MAVLITMLEQHLDRQPPTVVTQATAWWEVVLAYVKLQGHGLGVHLPVNVCCYSTLIDYQVINLKYMDMCMIYQ